MSIRDSYGKTTVAQKSEAPPAGWASAPAEPAHLVDYRAERQQVRPPADDALVEHPPGDGQDRDTPSDLQGAPLVRCRHPCPDRLLDAGHLDSESCELRHRPARPRLVDGSSTGVPFTSSAGR